MKLPLQAKGIPIPGDVPALQGAGVIQRALAYGMPANKLKLDADLAVPQRDHAHFDRGETLTRTWGVASDTSNFTASGGSDDVDSGANGNAIKLKWSGETFGYLRPLGKILFNFVPMVKMHLVNSYLHPNANNWGDNWVFGHGDLNHQHDNDIEEEAKKYHPASPTLEKTMDSGRPIYAISYRTEVVNRAGTNTTTAALADDIKDSIARVRPMGYTGPDRTDVVNNVTIDGQSVANYRAAWNAAVGNSVATKVSSEMRLYGIDADGTNLESKAVNLGDVTDLAAVQYRSVIDGKDGMWFAARRVFAEAPRKKRKTK